MHGIRGEVACADTIGMNGWRFAYQTHPRPWYPFITYLGEERQEESIVWRDMHRWKDQMQGAQPIVVPTPAVPDLFSQVLEPAATYQRTAA